MQILDNMNQYFSALGTAGLALNSFVESFFLVPPPDFLLIAMDLKNPNKALFYATICTIASTIGGLVGYYIGKFGGRPVFDWICKGFSKKGNNKAQEMFEKIEKLYEQFGAYAVFIAAFTPIPYKLFTIGSGILNMRIIPFTIASIIGRGLRFYIVSVVLMLFGEKIKSNLELVILGVTAVIVVFFIVLYKKRHKLLK